MSDLVFNAVFMSILISVICAVLGAFVVFNRLNYLCSSFAHASLGGIGMAVFFSLPIILISQLFTLVIGLVVGLVYYLDRERFSSYLDIIYAFGMALGMLFISMAANYQQDFSAYLFGSILLISIDDLLITALIGFGAIVYIAINYRNLIMVSFDPLFAGLVKVKVKFQFISLILILTILLPMLVRLTGITVTIALLTVGPLIFEKIFNSTIKIIIASALFNLVLTLTSLYFAIEFNTPLGVTISLMAVFVFGLAQAALAIIFKVQKIQLASSN